MARLVGLNDYHAALWGSRIRGSSSSSPLHMSMAFLAGKMHAGTEGRTATTRVVSAARRVMVPLSFRLATSMVFQVPFCTSAACTETGTYSILWYKRACCRASCKESTAPHDPRLLELSVEPHVSLYVCGCRVLCLCAVMHKCSIVRRRPTRCILLACPAAVRWMNCVCTVYMYVQASLHGSGLHAYDSDCRRLL